MTSSFVPNESLKRNALIGAALVAAPFVMFYGMSTGSYFLPLGLAVAPFFLMMVSRLSTWFTVVVGLFYSWIYVPGLPRSLSLFHIMAATILPVLLAARTMRPPLYRSGSAIRFMAIGYLSVVLATMHARGFGIRALGSETWGGAAYVHLLIALGFFLLSDVVLLSPRQWRSALMLYFVASLLPSLAEITFLLSRGQLAWFYQFIRPDGTSAIGNLHVMLRGEGVLRFQVSKYIAMLFVMCLALFPYRGKYKVWTALSFLVAFVFAGLSGHRTMVVYLFLLIPTVVLFTTRRFPTRLLLFYTLALVALFVLLALAGTKLPLAFQRAFSWVPFASISSAARESAMNTTNWRFEVWRQLLEYLPDYWLVGRGFAFESYDFYAAARMKQATIQWAITTHNYHSGPLSLLIDLGVFGLLAGTGLLLAAFVRHRRLLSAEWADESLARYHRVLFASFCVDVVRFYLIHGGAASSFVDFLVQLTLIEGIYRSNRHLLQERAGAPAPSPAALP